MKFGKRFDGRKSDIHLSVRGSNNCGFVSLL